MSHCCFGSRPIRYLSPFAANRLLQVRLPKREVLLTLRGILLRWLIAKTKLSCRNPPIVTIHAGGCGVLPGEGEAARPARRAASGERTVSVWCLLARSKTAAREGPVVLVPSVSAEIAETVTQTRPDDVCINLCG